MKTITEIVRAELNRLHELNNEATRDNTMNEDRVLQRVYAIGQLAEILIKIQKGLDS